MQAIASLKEAYYRFHRQRRQQAALSVLRRDLALRRPVVVVHQMGRAASMTLVNTLRSMDLGVSILHTHWLNSATVEERLERVRNQEIPWHLQVSQTLLAELGEDGLRDYPFRIVSAIREPVARNVSAYFLDIHRFVRNIGARVTRGDLSVDELTQIFLDDFPHHEVLEWFEQQLNRPLGIDWLSQPFDSAVGWELRRFGGREMLLIRSEDLNACFAEAFGSMFGSRPSALSHTHVTKNTSPYAGLFKEFRQHAALPESYLCAMFENTYASHFYSGEQISGYRQKWVAERPAC